MNEKSGFAEQMPAAIGRYQVQGSIGYGAMGAVYKAFDPLIKRTLAIKTIRLDIPRQSPQYKSFIERFYHEARISGTLSHPNIVTLFDIGEEGGIPYLAMEFVEGETLSSLLEKGLRFPPEKVIGLISQVASAVDYAHSRGVIHRDIKPSNLILFEGERVKVTDFGIAKLVDSEMTQAGTLLGTPSYMSPEQAMGDKLDGRSDIFSLGVCAFEMLSGEQPFPGANVTSILYKLVHVDPIEPPNLEMNGLVPQKWHDVFGKVLAKKPDERYQTASEFVQDLEYCLGSWFGAAMADAPMADAPMSETAPLGYMSPVAEPGASSPDGAKSQPVPDVTTAFPALTLPSTPAPAVPSPAAAEGPRPAASVGKTASEEAEDELPATVHMKAPAHDVGATIRMPSAGPKTPVPASTVNADVLASAATLKQPPPEVTVSARTPPAAPRSTPAAAPAAAPAGRPAAAPRRGMLSGLVMGGLALVLLAAAALAVWIVKGRNAAEPSPPPTTLAPTAAATPEPPPTTIPPEVLGSLHVESQPPGALITLNGEQKGPAPLDLPSLAVGNYEVRAELKGYEARSETVAITSDALQAEVKLVLARLPPVLGLADIGSTPPGAAVTVDGASVGETPLAGLKLRPGVHQVELAKDGYERRSESVRIEAGKRAKLDLPLVAIVKATPTPATPPPVVVDANAVYENTAQYVDTPARKIAGSSGSYPERAPRLDRDSQVSVAVNFVVNESGEVVDPKVTESAGKLIDEAVLNAIRTWRYEPAVKQGVKVKVRVRFKQTFRAGR